MNDEIVSKIKEFFKYLNEVGFSETIVTKPSPLGDGSEYQELCYLSDKIKVSFRFAEYVNGSFLHLFVSRLDQNKGFSFDDYFKYKKITNYGSEKDEDNETYLERISEVIINEFKNDLKDVLSASKWIEIPSDYGR